MASNKVALGISLALGAAVSWGAMGIAAQYLLHYCRFEAIDLVSIRLVSAGILLLLIYRILGGTDVMSPFSSRWAFTQVAIAGVTILGSQLTFMLSIKAADAALATILFTVIPLMCACYYCVVDKKFPSPATCLCFVLASAGVALVVTDGDFSKLNFSVVGLLWGLCSSALCALYSIQPQKVIKKLGVCPVVGWAMIIGGLVACCFNPPWTLQVDWNLNSIAAFTFIVTIGTVLSFWCYLSSVKYLSAVLVSLIGCMEPVTAYILSIMFYGKSVGLYELLGILFVFANVMIISIQSEEKKN